MLSKRAFLSGAVASGVVVASGVKAQTQTVTQTQGLPNLAAGAKPISVAERQARIARLQEQMQRQKIAGLLVEGGTSLTYFTGLRWGRSERVTAALIPAKGQTVIVTPYFEESRTRETLEIPADVRTWNEDESPYALIAGALKDRGAASGTLAVEGTTRYFIIDGLKQQGAFAVVSGEALVAACRRIKSPAELALMQTANDITLAALRHVHANIKVGMASRDIAALMNDATRALGGAPEFALTLLNEASAYPHGTKTPQTVREGSVILMDCGCALLDYESDITRTWVYGEATARQRKVWDTVRRGQEIVLETAKIGVPVAKLDAAVRAFYDKEGWGPGFTLPGLSHRAGHGIGMDGHEAPYLVGNDATPLEAGMCFSDEPGIYIPGEFGVRLEDCWYMTPTGPKLFSPLARSLEDPI
ncbi:M24 family metallopeptidase [Asticcacaulis excentricus]|uniref:Proline dipeptidase n=1 Tax=Asticcacaulis excentricus TaxID=78587 RepID=A0A3G9FZY8_9CAUL|nr:Xaa-Pro peptidase family protein [Asticcacaulis excentricus]BBF80600.1 proline dipeptidase [Asticcacaulis excentricus]